MITTAQINQVINLALQRDRAYNSNNKTLYNALDLQLETYLKNLSFDDIKSLQAIMYLGRDKDYDINLTPQEIYNNQFDYFDKVLKWNTQELETSQMLEKLPLGMYLEEGKKILGL